MDELPPCPERRTVRRIVSASPLSTVRYGWVEPDLDWKLPNLSPKIDGDWLVRDACRCYGSQRGFFQAHLPDGDYELEGVFAAVGPMNVTVQGGEWLSGFSANEKPIKQSTRATIQEKPLTV